MRNEFLSRNRPMFVETTLNTDFDCQDLFISTKMATKTPVLLQILTSDGENPLCIKVKLLVILRLVFIEL